jgi:predicted ATP-binding protein involved in virulence
MLKIQSLELSNYAGFNKRSLFRFTYTNGSYKPICVFFGPNGCGKSTGLNAIAVLSRAKAYSKRKKEEENLLLRKMQFHPDYDPNYAGFAKYSENMEMIAIFENQEGKELVVHIKDDDVLRNDLANLGSENVVFIDADHPINNSKFQIPSERISVFLELAEAIYGYKCFVEKPVSATGVDASNTSLKEIISVYANNHEAIVASNLKPNISTEEIYAQLSDHKNAELSFYQDFVIQKGDVKVHYKSMSAGEKKIATLLRNLCDPSIIDKSNIVIVDNIEMHVYFKRHVKMLEKILEKFPDKQFIVTTHSGVMIDHVKNKFGDSCLFDIPIIKGQPLVD